MLHLEICAEVAEFALELPAYGDGTDAASYSVAETVHEFSLQAYAGSVDRRRREKSTIALETGNCSIRVNKGLGATRNIRAQSIDLKARLALAHPVDHYPVVLAAKAKLVSAFQAAGERLRTRHACGKTG
jgi:hypothetical protein